MRIVCQQTILMKYHALQYIYLLFLKKWQNLKLSSAAAAVQQTVGYLCSDLGSRQKSQINLHVFCCV